VRRSSDIPGVEARAWFSPKEQRYFVQRWSNRGDAVDLWIAPEGEDMGYPVVAVRLPEDVFEIGANPTEFELENARGAAMAQHNRALAAEGRMERMRRHIMQAAGAPNLPLESLVDLLLARAGAEPLPVSAPPPPARPPTFDTALVRLTEIAGDRADMSSTWATVRGAMTKAAAGRDTGLFREVVELAAVVRVPVEENERNPTWLKS
jgi:hypothetical protein